jgi:carbonic anhydrase/acetyltransferase-like protein (isoleucine patch superfamily)
MLPGKPNEEEAMATTFDFRDGNGRVPAHRHVNPDGSPGGWVADTATVESTAIVADQAKVFGNAVVKGDAWVFERAKVCGDAVVADHARVFGRAIVRGNAEVCGVACVSGGSVVEGDAVVGSPDYDPNVSVFDVTSVLGGTVRGNARILDSAPYGEKPSSRAMPW